MLLAAVWWAWNYTAWATNWIDPDQPLVRVLLIGLMLLGLIMSAAIPDAFRSRGLEFAVPFVAMRPRARRLHGPHALRGSRMGRNYAAAERPGRGIPRAAWIAGALCAGQPRGRSCGSLAVLLDYLGPAARLPPPRGERRCRPRDWTLAGGHLAERGQLVILIALGESVLAVGETFAEPAPTAPLETIFAFVRRIPDERLAVGRLLHPARRGDGADGSPEPPIRRAWPASRTPTRMA